MGRWSGRTRVIVVNASVAAVAVAVGLALGGRGAAPAADRPTGPDNEVAPGAAGPAPIDPTSVTIEGDAWYSWALLDLSTGAVIGSENARTDTNNTESMIKAWLGADYIAGTEAEGRPLTDDERATISDMIRYSDDAAAQELYLARGGDEAVERLIVECGLTGTTVHPGWWSLTQITAADSVRMMQCILQRAETSAPTRWLLDEMRNVDESNAFGIAEALPTGTTVAVKNGWTAHGATGEWNVNCLAAWDDRVLSVLTRYPVALGQEYGAGICRAVTTQLLT